MEGCDVSDGVKELWEKMEMELEEVREMVRIGRVDKEGRGMVVVKLKGSEEKRRVMGAKKGLRGQREVIRNDLTGKERRAKCLIMREVEKERRRGRRV